MVDNRKKREDFYVLFGTDEAATYEEAEVYCEEGTTVDYRVVGIAQEDGIFFAISCLKVYRSKINESFIM